MRGGGREGGIWRNREREREIEGERQGRRKRMEEGRRDRGEIED